MSVFGFSTEPAGDFMPILKYDARAGRLFRVDRENDGDGFSNEPIDITASFKAIVDFENLEVGWIDFVAGSAPNFVLVKMGQELPPRPSDRHKNGVRFILKLAKVCGGTRPIREMAGTSKAFLGGIEAVYLAYQAAKDKNPGKLPVIVLEKTTPVKSGSGEKQSTNYQPTFKIVSWAPRGDLVFEPRSREFYSEKDGRRTDEKEGENPMLAPHAYVPSATHQGDCAVCGHLQGAPIHARSKASAAPQQPAQRTTPPATGSTKADPPKEMADADDFG